jgi:hypothetical protein
MTDWTVTGHEGFIGSQLKPGEGKVIVHLDAITGIGEAAGQPHNTFQRNVGITADWLEEARTEGYKMVFASSAAAATPTNPYAASKAMSEMWCEVYRKTYGVHVSILRFANVYGPGSQYKTSCIAQERGDHRPRERGTGKGLCLCGGCLRGHPLASGRTVGGAQWYVAIGGEDSGDDLEPIRGHHHPHRLPASRCQTPRRHVPMVEARVYVDDDRTGEDMGILQIALSPIAAWGFMQMGLSLSIAVAITVACLILAWR